MGRNIKLCIRLQTLETRRQQCIVLLVRELHGALGVVLLHNFSSLTYDRSMFENFPMARLRSPQSSEISGDHEFDLQNNQYFNPKNPLRTTYDGDEIEDAPRLGDLFQHQVRSANMRLPESDSMRW